MHFLDALSVEAGSLPDPSVSLGVANLPIDTFDFSQEGMTQFKVAKCSRAAKRSHSNVKSYKS